MLKKLLFFLHFVISQNFKFLVLGDFCGPDSETLSSVITAFCSVGIKSIEKVKLQSKSGLDCKFSKFWIVINVIQKS